MSRPAVSRTREPVVGYQLFEWAPGAAARRAEANLPPAIQRTPPLSKID